MIIVTGTKRSGTSMWMQILQNSGFPVIGDAFMGVWKDSIEQANRKGFFESKLRLGINHTVNPNSQNGVYLHPLSTAHHAVKVFVPGLIRSDYAFLHRVIATVRPWREYCSSIERLLAMEDAYMMQLPNSEGGLSQQAKIILRKPNVHPALIWWRDNFNLIFDAMSRQYPIQMVAYDRLLEQPEAIVSQTLEWLMASQPKDLLRVAPPEISIERGIQTVDLQMRTQHGLSDIEVPLPSNILAVFDAFYDCFYKGNSELTQEMRSKINDTQHVMEGIYKEQDLAGKKRKREALEALGISAKALRIALKRTQMEDMGLSNREIQSILGRR